MLIVDQAAINAGFDFRRYPHWLEAGVSLREMPVSFPQGGGLLISVSIAASMILPADGAACHVFSHPRELPSP
jgi:hypothetical protein